MAGFTSPGLILASNQAIMEAQRAIAFAKMFSTDFSAELQGVGKTIAVPVFSGNATEFNETSNNYETTDGSIIPVNVTLDKLVKVTYKLGQSDLTEVNKSSTSRNCGVAGGRAIGRKLEEIIMDAIKGGTAQANVASFTVAKLGKAIAAAEKADLDPASLVAVLNPDTYGDLLDANVNNAAIQGSNIASALGAKYGIKGILCSSKAEGAGYLIADSAVAIAGRAIEQAVDGMYSEYGTETDEASGLTVTAFVHGTTATNSRYMNVAALLGCKLTRTEANKAPGFVTLAA